MATKVYTDEWNVGLAPINFNDLKLYQLDADTLALENLAGGTRKDLRIGDLYAVNVYFTTAIFGGSITGSWNPSVTATYSLGDRATPLMWLDGAFSGIVNIGVYDATDTTPLQVRSGSAGVVTPIAGTVAVFESSGATRIAILSPENQYSVINFGTPATNTRGGISYGGSTSADPDKFLFYTADTLRLKYSAGAFAFQEYTVISSTADMLLTSNTLLYLFNNNGTGKSIIALPTGATDGAINDAPSLILRACYDSDPTAGVTSTVWDYTILHDMITGGATPKSQAIHSINAVPILSLENDNGTIASIFGAGKVYINDTSNANMTLGLTINQGAADNEILALKSSDVTHGLVQVAETDTFAAFKKWNDVGGGLHINTITTSGAAVPFKIEAYSGGNVDTTKSTAGRAGIELQLSQHDGANGLANIVADGNVLGVRARVGAAYVTVAIIDEDGDLWLNGGITVGASIYLPNTYGLIVNTSTTAHYNALKAYDVDAGGGAAVVELARWQNANDPFFLIGRDDTGVATNAVTDMLVLQAGAGANNESTGFGYGISIKLGNAASEVEERASMDYALTTATNGSEAAKYTLNLMNAGSMGVAFQVNSKGHVGLAGNNADDYTVVGATKDLGIITNNSSRMGYSQSLTMAKTASTWDGYFWVGRFTGAMGASNTQNWTDTDYGYVGIAVALDVINGASGTIASAKNLVIEYTNVGSAAVTITNKYGICIEDSIGIGAITNQYGLHIAALTKGGTLNYGIYTSADIFLNDVKVWNLKAGTTAINPEVAHRGQMYFVEGGAGVADKLYCIMKNTADAYEAVEVAIAS